MSIQRSSSPRAGRLAQASCTSGRSVASPPPRPPQPPRRLHRPQVVGLCAAALAAAVASTGAQATPFTLTFEGEVRQALFDPFDPLAGAVQPGSPMQLYLNLDSAAPDQIADPRVGSYTVNGGTFGAAAIVGGVVFPVMRSVNLSVVNGAAGGTDQYLVYAFEGEPSGLADYFSLSMLLEDPTGSALDSDALPTSAPDLSRFAVRSFTLAGQYTDMNQAFVQYEVQGDLLRAQAVPEPATAALLGAALLAGVASRSRRRPVSQSPQP